MDEKSIMVNLGDEKVKEIGEVIGNKTCNRILDYLSDNEGTVSDISAKLKAPINTIDYNVKKLVKAGLIEKNSHFWSVKGKKMPVYKISNKKIIISPKRSVTKVFAWTIGLTGLMALTIRQFLEKTSSVADVAQEMMFEAAPVFASKGTESVSFLSSIGAWEWFLIGAWFAVFLFFIFSLYSERKTRGLS